MNFIANDKLLILGSSGLVGSHLSNILPEFNIKKVIKPSSKELNLMNFNDLNYYLKEHQPNYIINLAGKVGGILSNKLYPADFYFQNNIMNTNLFEASSKLLNLKKLICLGAGCGYPLNEKEPLKEENIFNGLAQKESLAYSSVKKMLIIQSQSYNQQYKLDSTILIPSNIYGEYDNFDLKDSHVIPALIRKFYEAKKNKKVVDVWGDGKAKRDFIHAEDVARACILGLNKKFKIPAINICNGKQFQIKEIINFLKEIVGKDIEINYQTNMPSGQHSREFSTANMNKLFSEFKPKFDIKTNLKRTYDWFSKNYKSKSIRL